jgi:hypothetical protein
MVASIDTKAAAPSAAANSGNRALLCATLEANEAPDASAAEGAPRGGMEDIK